MSLNIDQFVERVFSQLPGTPRPEIRDDIAQVQFDALSSLGELISNSPLRSILSKEFQVSSVAGICDLSTTTLVGGAALSTANVFSLVVDTIKRHRMIHPDSLEPVQPERGNTIHVDHPRRDNIFGYLLYTVAQNSIYIRNENGLPPSDQTVIFRCSFAPTLGFFSGTGPTYQELENTLISIAVKLVMGGAGQAAQAS